jgi:hypothetical protein
MSYYIKLKDHPSTLAPFLKQAFPKFFNDNPKTAFEHWKQGLIEGMLNMDPKKRFSCEQITEQLELLQALLERQTVKAEKLEQPAAVIFSDYRNTKNPAVCDDSCKNDMIHQEKEGISVSC